MPIMRPGKLRQSCTTRSRRAIAPEVPFTNKKRAEVKAQRLRMSLSQLQQHLDAAYVLEQYQCWLNAHVEMKAVEDELSERFAREYVEHSTKLAALFRDVTAHDAAISEINQMAPAGEPRRLRPIELASRNLGGFSLATPSLMKTAIIPDFDQSDTNLWPIKQLPDPNLYNMSNIHRSPYEGTAEWWKGQAGFKADRDQQDATQTEQQRRDFYGIRNNG
jgi:hypothetical protein